MVLAVRRSHALLTDVLEHIAASKPDIPKETWMGAQKRISDICAAFMEDLKPLDPRRDKQ
jgi:hypothetical protein